MRIKTSVGAPNHCLNLWLVPLAILLMTARPSVFAQGTAFTYQGRLNAGGNPATGIYDLTFTIYDAVAGGTAAGAPITSASVGITNGLFTVTLDFGAGVLNGSPRWLDIAVRTNGAGSFTTLTPRQPLTPTPYAITAGNVSGSVPASQLSGVVPLAQLPAAVLTNNATGVTVSGIFSGNFGGSFSGNGAGLTGVFGIGATNGVNTNLVTLTGAGIPNANGTYLLAGGGLFINVNGKALFNQYSGTVLVDDGVTGEGWYYVTNGDGTLTFTLSPLRPPVFGKLPVITVTAGSGALTDPATVLQVAGTDWKTNTVDEVNGLYSYLADGVFGKDGGGYVSFADPFWAISDADGSYPYIGTTSNAAVLPASWVANGAGIDPGSPPTGTWGLATNIVLSPGGIGYGNFAGTFSGGVEARSFRGYVDPTNVPVASATTSGLLSWTNSVALSLRYPASGWRLPPMGYITWFPYGTFGATETNLWTAIALIKDNQLDRYGYTFICPDDIMTHGASAAFGYTTGGVPYSTNFAEGFAALFQRVHTNGLKMGWYFYGSYPANMTAIAKWLRDNQVDFVHLDYDYSYPHGIYKQFASVLRQGWKNPPFIVANIKDPDSFSDDKYDDDFWLVPDGFMFFTSSAENYDPNTPARIYDNANVHFRMHRKSRPGRFIAIAPGTYYPGRNYHILFGLWCLSAGPLMPAVFDIPQDPHWTPVPGTPTGICTNLELIAIDQDPAVNCARILCDTNNLQFLCKDQQDGSKVLGVFHHGTNGVINSWSVPFSALNIPTDTALVRDVFFRTNCPAASGGMFNSPNAVTNFSLYIYKLTPYDSTVILGGSTAYLLNGKVVTIQ